MRRYRSLGLTLVALLGTTSARAADSAAPTAGAPAPRGAGDQALVAYPAAFFADARPNNAFDMIQRLPGFSFDGGAQVRGFAGAAGNVLIDGERPTTKQDDLQSILRRIPAGQVDHIDVIRGGAPGIDMQGQTVIANVVRKKGGGMQGVASVSNNTVFKDGRNVQGVRLEFTKRDDGRSFEAALNTGQFADNGVAPGPHTETDGAGNIIYQSHLAARAGGAQTVLTAAYEDRLAGGKFRINGLLYSDYYLDNEADLATLPAIGGDDRFRDKPTTKKAELGVHYSRDFGTHTSLELLAIQQVQQKADHSHYLAVGDEEFFNETDNLAESIVRGVLRYRASDHLSFEMAAEGAYNVQNTETNYLVNAVDQGLPAHVQEAEKRGEVAASATWSPTPKYTLEAGVRTEASTIRADGDIAPEGKTLVYPKPRLVFTWSPDKDDQVRLRAEREVGQLDFGAFAASSQLNAGGVHLGNPGLLPQDVWVGEATYERRFWKTGDATVTLRHSEINDTVDRTIGQIVDPNPPHAVTYFDEPGNIGRGREDDLIVNLTLPLGGIGISNGLLKTTGTWRTSQVTDPTTLAQRPLTQLHQFDGELHFTQDLNSLKSTWGLDAYSGYTEPYYRYDEIDLYRWGGQYTLFYEYKPNAKLSLRMEFSDNIGKGFQATHDYYSVSRSLTPIPDQIDTRTERLGQMLYFRLRKTFG